MPRKEVHLIKGHFYHIYNRAVSDNLLFTEEENYIFFLSKIKQYLNRSASVLAYCLLPNHYHLIVQLKDTDLPSSMQRMALSYVVAYNKQYNRKGHLFSGKYQRIHIHNHQYLLHLSRYIHLNPVKANIVSSAEDWEFSSYREYIGIQKPYYTDPMIILDMICAGSISKTDEKYLEYQNFVEEWDFEFMDFKILKN